MLKSVTSVVFALFLAHSLGLSSPAYAITLTCKSSVDRRDPHSPQSEFTVYMDRAFANSPFPVLIYDATIRGFQDSEPRGFDGIFQHARVVVEKTRVLVRSSFRSGKYQAFFEAVVDRGDGRGAERAIWKGRFHAVDNWNGSQGVANALGSSAIPVDCVPRN